ncbi:flagellar basal body rod protein FlgB [Candidatus Formimonas warabiya]|uniref:Flagellar basal body rod protein FlgB n=1 Tax=Formimonas warabiya TaxID=1761012 RepID=A0A3G1KT92_FORW1|nr:flagellar basal body rod protein FlgB [Candidatus Formimonas warabiya]ATW25669.1 flagellar basal-body rod protein FlgB [Candidatus Formimonas warabiya]
MSGFFNNDVISLTLKELDAIALRQKTIAQNVANVNTPGYKRLEIRFEDKLAQVLKKLDEGKLTDADIEDLEPEVVQTKGTTQRQDGNNVNLEVEMTQMLINTVLYNTLTQQLSSQMANLRTAMNDGR